MSDRRDGPAVVAHAGDRDLIDPDGRVRIERVGRAVVADYAAHVDCVVLEAPGGGIDALETLRDRQVPTVLYDRSADPTVATAATRLGVTEYLTDAALGEATLVDAVVSVVRRSRAEGTGGTERTERTDGPAEPTAMAEVRSVIGDRSLSVSETVEGLFEVGQRHLGLEAGALAAVDGREYTVVGGTETARRADVSLSETLCRLAVRTDGPVRLPDTAWGPPAETLAEPFARLGSYIGDDVAAGGWYGTVWFGSERSRGSFSAGERALFELLVELLRAEIDRRQPPGESRERPPDGRAAALASDGSGTGAIAGSQRAGAERAAAEAADPDGVETVETDRFSELFERFPDAVADVEFREGTPIVRDVNKAFEETFGYEEPTAVGAPLGDLIVPAGEEPEAVRLDESAVQHDGTSEVERLTDEGLGSFLFRGVSYRRGETERGFVIYTDIADRLEQERQLRVLHRVLRHNLRNEMTAIIGYADMLTADASGERREFAERIHSEAIDVSKLAEQVKRIEQALDVDRKRVSIDPESVVRGLAERFRAQYPEATIRVRADECGAVVADELLETAVENLVENAIEHHPGEPTVEIGLSTVDGEWLDLSVRDDGEGIPERERAIVSGDREITQLDHSRGLGLWVSKWIVSGVNGRLLFGDAPSGSEVVLRLRRADGR